eukprot:TRINITY_DN12405_c0_g1_i2.p3 TRINITY_DN12405_c0_g1~~TRINITY_DN12405_c0_g1_i2.p3  ORF type:complete len:126 (+),score=25.57 TRINITY_DN12405_c0_g1_i2:272-649(+)
MTSTLKQQIEQGTLSRGDIFAGRVMLTPDDGKSDVMEKIEPAKLSVIAESHTVEVFTLERTHFAYIPDYLQKAILNGLQLIKEFDDVDVNQLRREDAEWTRKKEKLIDSYIKERTIKKPGRFKLY